MRGRTWLALALLVAHLLMGHRYAAAWVSDLALWQWARVAAPGKLRPVLNYEKARYLQTP